MRVVFLPVTLTRIYVQQMRPSCERWTSQQRAVFFLCEHRCRKRFCRRAVRSDATTRNHSDTRRCHRANEGGLLFPRRLTKGEDLVFLSFRYFAEPSSKKRYEAHGIPFRRLAPQSRAEVMARRGGGGISWGAEVLNRGPFPWVQPCLSLLAHFFFDG